MRQSAMGSWSRTSLCNRQNQATSSMTRATKLRDTHVSLAHGNGGRMMREMIEELFAPALGNPPLDTTADAVRLPIPVGQDLLVTTDGFTVKPLEFPGGNIGSLAVH